MAAPTFLRQIHSKCLTDPRARRQEPRQQSTLQGRVTALESNVASIACEGRDGAASLGRTMHCARGQHPQQGCIWHQPCSHQPCSHEEGRTSSSSSLTPSMCQPSRFRRRTATHASERPPHLPSHKDSTLRPSFRFQGALQRWLQLRGRDRDVHHFPPQDSLRSGKEAALRQEAAAAAAALRASPGPLSRDLQDSLRGGKDGDWRQESAAAALRASPGPLSRDLRDSIAGGKEGALRQEAAAAATAALHVSSGPFSRDLQDSLRGLGEVSPGEEALAASSRQRLELTLALAFVLNNMDKVSLSVAIIVMAQQLEWSTSTQGLVQASFFWGYALTQIPGGWMAQRIGGESMLWAGVLLWSLATLAVPTCAAASIPAMLIARVLVGLGEGVAPSAATDAIARNVPAEQRSRAVSLVFGGFNVGSVLGLILSPVLVEAFGWESVFHVFGALGIVWCAGYSFLRGPSSSSLSLAEPAGHQQPQPSIEASRGEPSTLSLSGLSRWQSETGSGSPRGAKDLEEGRRRVPWKGLLRNQSVRALIACHFCHDWGKYCLQAWLPTFYASYLHLSLTEASMAALIPPVGSVIVAAVAGNLADSLVAGGMPRTQVRRICQSIAFTAPALAMAGAWAVMEAQGDPSLVLLLLSGGLALSSFSLAGLYCSHQDISPKYSPVLLGLSNTAGALPGFIGVTLTGYLYEVTHSWNVALFLPSIVVLGLGASIWLKWVDNSEVDFDSECDVNVMPSERLHSRT